MVSQLDLRCLFCDTGVTDAEASVVSIPWKNPVRVCPECWGPPQHYFTQLYLAEVDPQDLMASLVSMWRS